ncbi:MAG: hypothetical protein ACUZ8E_08375 [Candidatus Anammoxibacter sp.]
MTQKLLKHKILVYLSIILSLSLFLSITSFAQEQNGLPGTFQEKTSKNNSWTGIDVSIVGKYATKYGRPPRDPYINTDQGDLLLFVFTLSGVVGGFVIGFNARKLFFENLP